MIDRLVIVLFIIRITNQKHDKNEFSKIIFILHFDLIINKLVIKAVLFRLL